MEDGLTVARALEIAQRVKAADKNAKELQSTGFISENVHLTRSSRKCYRCGQLVMDMTRRTVNFEMPYAISVIKQVI